MSLCRQLGQDIIAYPDNDQANVKKCCVCMCVYTEPYLEAVSLVAQGITNHSSEK